MSAGGIMVTQVLKLTVVTHKWLQEQVTSSCIRLPMLVRTEKRPLLNMLEQLSQLRNKIGKRVV